MVFHFVILSDEVDDFRREIRIDAEATFQELQNVILKSCNYKQDQMTSFFICESDWSKKIEITAVNMNDDPNAESWTMDKTHLDDQLKEEKTKLLFLFDTMCERFLYMQLKTVENGIHLKTPEVTVSKGKAPVQLKNIDDIAIGDVTGDMYGSEDYDPEEMDQDGYMSLDDMNADTL
jgi:hypothetical protein